LAGIFVGSKYNGSMAMCRIIKSNIVGPVRRMMMKTV